MIQIHLEQANQSIRRKEGTDQLGLRSNGTQSSQLEDKLSGDQK